MKGDGYTAGGLIIFNKSGEPMYIYEEDTGSEFVMDDVKAALQAVRMAVSDVVSSEAVVL